MSFQSAVALFFHHTATTRIYPLSLPAAVPISVTDDEGCDDCSSGTYAVANDGIDTDSDGACDFSDLDDDNDGVPDDSDNCVTADFNLSADVDGDGCDDADEDTYVDSCESDWDTALYAFKIGRASCRERV